MFNGLRYVVKTGAPWRWMPNDLPPWSCVYQQARRWLAAGCFEALVDDLRAVLRLADGRAPEPSAVVMDIPGIEQLVYPFLVIYGISYFFTEFGPNATTFVYPAELFPVEARTTGHGIASAAGKVGVFLFPILLSAGGLFAAELAAAAVSLVGIAVTVFMLPETKGRSLEEISAESAPRAA